MSLNWLDLFIVFVVSLFSSILVIVIYTLVKNRKYVYINFANVSNTYYGKDKNGYIEKEKRINEKTTYVECNYILSLSNCANKPYTLRNINVVGKKNRKNKLEEGCLNLNGTAKSVAGVTSYDKLKHLVIKPYECIDHAVNIRLSKDEYIKYKKIYLSYIGSRNKAKYIMIKIKKENKEISIK